MSEALRRKYFHTWLKNDLHNINSEKSDRWLKFDNGSYSHPVAQILFDTWINGWEAALSRSAPDREERAMDRQFEVGARFGWNAREQEMPKKKFNRILEARSPRDKKLAESPSESAPDAIVDDNKGMEKEGKPSESAPGTMPSCHVCGTIMTGVCPKCSATTKVGSAPAPEGGDIEEQWQLWTNNNPDDYSRAEKEAFIGGFNRATKPAPEGMGRDAVERELSMCGYYNYVCDVYGFLTKEYGESFQGDHPDVDALLERTENLKRVLESEKLAHPTSESGTDEAMQMLDRIRGTLKARAEGRNEGADIEVMKYVDAIVKAESGWVGELKHAVMCMDRSCERCTETARELGLRASHSQPSVKEK